MNKKDARATGFGNGYAAGAYGTDGVLDEERFFEMAYASEENARQFSPFELTAHEINESGNRAEGLWEAYDKGVEAGAKAAWKERWDRR